MQNHLLFIGIKNKDNLFEITLELKPSANKIYTFEYVTHKFNQDLIDYKKQRFDY